MKKNLCKKFFTLIITLLMTIVGGSKVFAFDNKIGPIKEGNWVGNYSTDLYFSEKLAGNTYVFCTSGIDAPNPFGRECTLKKSQWNEGTQAAIGAIIDSFDQNLKNTNTNPTLNSTYTKFWYTEIAINSYLGNDVDKNWGTNTEKNETVVALKKLASAAYTKAVTEFKVSLSSNNLNFKKDGNYYVSDKITVDGKYLESFEVSVSGTNNAEVIEKNSNSFKVRFPASNLGLGQTIKVTANVTGKKSYKVAKNYDCGSDVQNVTIDYLERVIKTSNASATGSVTKNSTNVEISKVDITNQKELAGATLVIKDSKGNIVDKWESTTTPHIIKNKLEAGEYTLTETIAPKGYKKSTKEVKFTVKDDGTTTKVKFENEPNKTGVKLSKVDITNQKELAGATLVIKNAKTNKVVKTWVSTGKTEFIELEAGEYTLTETIAPKGYKKSTKTVKFTVKDDGTVDTVKFENEPNKTGVKLSKVDITNQKELAGATLVIKNAKTKKVVKTWVSTGKTEFIELEPGNYILSETIAPKGYKKSTKEVKFTVKDDGTVDTVKFENEPNKTGAKISKQDITNKQELPGAKLVIKDENGEIKHEWVSGDKPVYVELEPGKYTLSETIAPVGYKLSTETIAFEVKEDGTTTNVVMYNELNKTGVKISKQDITTKKELPGATLIVKNSNGEEVARWISGENPYYIELTAGEYTLTEVTAPEGYDLSYEVIKFTVNEDGTATSDVIMYNSQTPKTADRNILLTVIGLIGTGIIGAVAIKKLKHQM